VFTAARFAAISVCKLLNLQSIVTDCRGRHRFASGTAVSRLSLLLVCMENRGAILPAHCGTSLSIQTKPLTPTVFFFCRLGDMVMVTSLLNLLHKRFGSAVHVVGTGSWTAAIYEGNPDVAAVWSFHRHVPFVFERSWRQLRRALRATHPGPIYVCERHYRQLPRIRRMLRWSGIDPGRCVFLSDEMGSAPEHLVDRLQRQGTRTPPALRAADYPVPGAAAVVGPRLYVLPAERLKCREWLLSQGWGRRDLIIVQPGNHRSMGPRRDRWRRLNTDDKWWPLDRWTALLQRVHSHHENAQLLLRGSAEEVPMLEEIRAAAGLARVAVVGTDLQQLFALCEAAHSMISVDTGPAHAAAALSLPLVVLYGAESPTYWLPRSPYGSPVVSVGGPPASDRADQVSVEQVFAAWRAVAEQIRPEPRRLSETG
jgi:ADP-heptose:LPS heptosyltransferase